MSREAEAGPVGQPGRDDHVFEELLRRIQETVERLKAEPAGGASTSEPDRG